MKRHVCKRLLMAAMACLLAAAPCLATTQLAGHVSGYSGGGFNKNIGSNTWVNVTLNAAPGGGTWVGTASGTKGSVKAYLPLFVALVTSTDPTLNGIYDLFWGANGSSTHFPVTTSRYNLAYTGAFTWTASGTYFTTVP